MTTTPLLSARLLTRNYPGVRALDAVNFDLLPGEVHVLFGENGAGKSTLISILSGALSPSSGHIEMRGEVVNFASVHEARQRGISAVFQEFSLIPQMSVEENLFLGAEHRMKHWGQGMFLDKRAMRVEAVRLLDELGFALPPNRRADHLTRAEQQMLEIAKAFRSELSVLILDEPTASLTAHETKRLFALIRQLTAKGVGIIYITHRMGELRQIGDRISVLRDGRHVKTLPLDAADDATLVRLMSGREVGAVFPRIKHPRARKSANAIDDAVLRLDRLSTEDGGVKDVSLHVNRGEIVGMAGLVGSGKSAAMRAAFGIVPVASGQVFYGGAEITGQMPKQAIRRGFLYLPADRKHDGLVMMRAARESISLAALDVPPFCRGGIFIKRRDEKRQVGALAEQLNLSPNQPERAVEHFSGGNQQKLMLARSLTRDFDLIIFDEPTVGVDVGARVAIYRFIAALAESGVTVVIVSSDLPEILHLSSRAYVFCRGRITAEIPRARLSEEAVLKHFFDKEQAA